MPDIINVTDFDLTATLMCGQAFRWTRSADGWFTGVVGREVWRLRQNGNTVAALVKRGGKEITSEEFRAYQARLQRYLALDRSLSAIVATFPADKQLQAAVKAHWGMRVVRQDSWETLASFIASSTKQIVQIRQIVAELSRRFGEPLGDEHYSFPTVAVVARAPLPDLLACKLGFRAKHLLAAAQAIDTGTLRLAELPAMEYDRALEELVKLKGVGEKIAACTLLFGCGFDQAFPIDVWVERSLRRLYFPRRKRNARQLREFARQHFGPHAGWAQQYLFFSERTLSRRGAVVVAPSK